MFALHKEYAENAQLYVSTLKSRVKWVKAIGIGLDAIIALFISVSILSEALSLFSDVTPAALYYVSITFGFVSSVCVLLFTVFQPVHLVQITEHKILLMSSCLNAKMSLPPSTHAEVLRFKNSEKGTDRKPSNYVIQTPPYITILHHVSTGDPKVAARISTKQSSHFIAYGAYSATLNEEFAARLLRSHKMRTYLLGFVYALYVVSSLLSHLHEVTFFVTRDRDLKNLTYVSTAATILTSLLFVLTRSFNVDLRKRWSLVLTDYLQHKEQMPVFVYHSILNVNDQPLFKSET